MDVMTRLRNRIIAALVNIVALTALILACAPTMAASEAGGVTVTTTPIGTLQTRLSTNDVWSGMIDDSPGGRASLAALNAEFIRLHVGDDGSPAAMPEIKQGAWDFSALDVLVNDVFRAGQQPLMNIKFAPDWMWTCYPNSIGVANKQGNGRVADLTFQTFAQYMARLVSYYNKGAMTTESGAVVTNPAGGAHPIKYWELWNEPDLNNETPCAPADGYGITVDQYVTMWNAVTAAMLRVDPTLRFVGPATAGSQFGESTGSGNAYIDAVMSSAGVKPVVISFHGYGYWDNSAPDAWLFDGDNSDPTSHCCGGISDLQRGVLAVQAQYPGVPIWLTEVNVNADWGTDPSKRVWGELGAAWWGAAFQTLASAGAGAIYQYDAVDGPQFGTFDPASGKPYVAYYAIQLLGEAFPEGSTILATTSAQPGVLSLAARKPDGAITVLVVNRQVSPGVSRCGAGGTAVKVPVLLTGITPTSVTLQQLDQANVDCAANVAMAPASRQLDPTQPVVLDYPGYGFGILTVLATDGP